jgi:tRNA-splicing ligase RtcB
MLEGEAVEQLVNVATLPGVVGYVYGMPDMHDGYGFPVGGVAAMAMPHGVISPGGVGFDINCGVRLLASPVETAALGDRLEKVVHELSRAIASGTGKGGFMNLADHEMDGVLTQGSRFLVERFLFGSAEDLDRTESGGMLPGADVSLISKRARDRGRDQLGSMGSGNHFVEVQTVDEVFDEHSAGVFGLRKGYLTVLIHTGSRGLGHQVCTDYVRIMDNAAERLGIVLPDRQLACAPADSPEGQQYLGAMAGAANFAWANRQLIMHIVRDVFARMIPGVSAADVRLVYDVAHNIAKTETYAGRTVSVHRKGATRAFGPSHAELPAAYHATGQPVFIPGSMGTSSYVMAGLDSSDGASWGSACHGAGRALSRGSARRQIAGSELRKELESRGITVRSPSNKGLAEEAPFAYKDVERVVEVVERAGLARKVARLVPRGIVKG